ncbi:MAG TPA: hypothetical protein DDZ89_20975 [Clostridiales bacterium]|nr:hypothetical protein [Clostridiales bacterium]
MKKLLVLIHILCMVMFFSCEKFNTESENRVIGLDEKNIFDDKPLRILIKSNYNNFGVGTSGMEFSNDQLFNVLDEVNYECYEQLGYTVEFISFPEIKAGNEYLLTIQAGLEFDLIFPTKAGRSYTNLKNSYYWNDEFISYYMDLSPYLSTYCPDVYMNMQKYDYVMDMVTKDEKVFALYAGVPVVSHMALLIKNEIIQEYNIQRINNFDELHRLMELMRGKEENNDNQKVLVAERTLLNYAIIRAGYYNLNNDIVFQLNDGSYKPYLIEDTDIFDVFFNEFSRFFEQSYFMLQSPAPMRNGAFDPIFSENGVSMFLADHIFYFIFQLFYFDDYPKENPWDTYSLFILDDSTPVINSADSIQLVPVPYTCTQPEKAISFVNWLFTDEDVGQLLTFGTDKGKYPGYKTTSDGKITYEQNTHTVYLLDNLLANFSDRLFPFDNKSMDQSKDYIALAQKAIYPPLYRFLETNHNENMRSFELMGMSYYNNLVMKQREEYINSSIRLLFEDPKAVTAHEMKTTLDSMTDKDTALRNYKDFVEKLFR